MWKLNIFTLNFVSSTILFRGSFFSLGYSKLYKVANVANKGLHKDQNRTQESDCANQTFFG